VIGGSIVYLASRDVDGVSGADIFVFALIMISFIGSYIVIKKGNKNEK
jgi:hypothetical protein